MVGTDIKRRQVFTLEGAEHAYRMLIESMNEGALILRADKTILYANACFARLVKYPLAQIVGGSFHRFLSREDAATLRTRMKRASRAGAKMQVMLQAGDGSLRPVQISVREMARDHSGRVTIGMVVTDLTEARRGEEKLRALTHRVVQAQEVERERVALELHDNIAQLLCALLFRSQALVTTLASRDGPPEREAVALRAMLGQAAQEVERVARNLRPGVLKHLGLVAAVRAASTEFSNRTNVPVRLSWVNLAGRLSEAMPTFEQAGRTYRAIAKRLAEETRETAEAEVEALAREAERVSGFPVEFEEGDFGVQMTASSEMAWKHGRDHHVIRLRSSLDPVVKPHMRAHELCHDRGESKSPRGDDRDWTRAMFPNHRSRPRLQIHTGDTSGGNLPDLFSINGRRTPGAFLSATMLFNFC